MTISIRWERSSACKTWTHGYVGDRRLFTIEEENQMPVLLLRHLPGSRGTQVPAKCASREDAKERAVTELTEFIKHLGDVFRE